jgi:hypothetical protein
MKKLFAKEVDNCWNCPNRFNIGGGDAKCAASGELVEKDIPPSCPLLDLALPASSADSRKGCLNES